MLAEPRAGGVCDRALEEHSTSAYANFGKGLVDAAKGNDETALTRFNVAMKSDPYFSEAIVAREQVY
ncbi:hypothetical protein [Methylobacterium sp. WL120]|uniref:hypothetical protein n=1 Tax=Methylobacterium sp. WL120 TaxID=2603887 RepID=UPI0011CBC4C0|nr:hypothetical protein [Methylobacterium sp. WL120]TXM64419.1 hypothetical protein FV229_18725 [Methylobacterium sp. WL120]